MTIHLDLADIQGNLLNAYGRIGFPLARNVLLHVKNAQLARDFLDEIRLKITTAQLWPSSKTRGLSAEMITAQRPDVAINVAFTFMGLLALEVPVRTLRGMPDEFQQGMRKRAPILQDDDAVWDPIWLAELDDHAMEVHILITLNGAAQPQNFPSTELALDDAFAWLAQSCAVGGGVDILSGHRGPNPLFQQMGALLEADSTGSGGLHYSRKEHFGFTDGIGDPVFEGQYPQKVIQQKALGQGKLNADQSWSTLATGEFLLGYPDEAQEMPGSAMPLDFSRNGTFLAYRKLHQNVQAFRDYVGATAVPYGQFAGLTPAQADQTLRAKMAGRWPDGVPLMKAGTYEEWQQVRARIPSMSAEEVNKLFVDFTYSSDSDGSLCPFSSHLRRSNPRDMLDPNVPLAGTSLEQKPASSVLNNRRRILRRGLPYGSSDAHSTDQEEHGVLMLVVCASLFRQFEFIQQQWMQYGLDFSAGNDSCPLIGNHLRGDKFVIPATRASGQPPFICDQPPKFVETRGGAYFFVPSLTALRMIAQGLTDPT